jgi:hypothetical protein
MLEYTVVYKQVKYITLRITANGQLLVTAPRRTSKAAIEKVITQKAAWIAQHQQKAAQLQQQRQQQGLHNCYQDGGKIGYLGQLYPLVVKTDGTRCWQWDGKQLLLQGCGSEALCRQLVADFYRQQLSQQILPALNEQVRQQLAVLPLPEPTFTVRKMRASWGLCYSQQKKIVLNLWLAMAPWDCIRQVLVHEYLHFCQSNHSTEFYRLLEQFEPQYRQLKHILSVTVDLQELSQT